jgi:hypothetical protein
MNIYDFQKAANQSYAARLADVISDLQVLNERVATGTRTEIERVRLEHDELVSFLNKQLEAKIEAMVLASQSLQRLIEQSVETTSHTRTKILDGEITLPEARGLSEPAEFQEFVTEPGNMTREEYESTRVSGTIIHTDNDVNVTAIAARFGAGPRKKST